MKMIVCVTRSEMLEPLRAALVAAGVTGMTVSDVRGFGAQGGRTEVFRGQEYTVEFMHKIKLEIVIPADLTDQVVKIITETARTGEVGDGKLFILNVEETVRIRTGEVGRTCC